MFNLLISSKDEAWEGAPYVYHRTRVFERADSSIEEQFGDLNNQQVERLCAIPALFAYENGVGKNARLGRITRIRVRGFDVRVEYELAPSLPEISEQQIDGLVWELDIGGWEMTRTHWAVKNVNLVAELQKAGILAEAQLRSLPGDFRGAYVHTGPTPEPVPIQPTLFRVPPVGIEPDLVSVMYPYQSQFNGVFDAIRAVGQELGLRVQSANEVWNESEIIQDIFSLIYRSSVVVCDFSDRNSNVFYEAGIAHTLGRPVIPLVQNIEHIPFDLRQHRHVVYLNNGEGLSEMQSQLRPRLAKLTGRGAG